MYVGHGRAGQGRAGQGRAGQGRAGQGRTQGKFEAQQSNGSITVPRTERFSPELFFGVIADGVC